LINQNFHGLEHPKKITITKDDTIVLNGGGEKSDIEERCNQLRDSLKQEGQSEFDTEKK